MRKMQKNQILEIIDSLQQAHEEIKTALQQKNNVLAQKQTILRMLCECQETAVSIGESIEKAEGEKHITVSYLEEYCELLFKIYEEIDGSNIGVVSGTDKSVNAVDKVSINQNKIYKSLRKQLIKIENSVKNDITARKEIAFFPYKASMWDSLESVYLAAKEDPDCDAYCIPIPYYDLNPDHSFGEMHYEGGVYPKNIEVTDWQKYSFEERRPDEIYIHNGYDNWNLVTSVHPRFYSDNLRKYTEKLIYIPYFILGEIEPDNQMAIEGMKHFCFMPGIINADKVIVQSEKMKQIYVNEYLKAAKANGLTGKHLDRKYLEQKFLGLGSPKIDKVLNTKKEDLEIPAEWLKVIQKPDGSWKKIIFYNTGISALLQYNEKWVDKIEDVLRIFKDNQDEVALLWRPHPLIENTMKSMRPEALQKYLQIKGQYLKEKWGIYDDTADVDRAVILSDAYYGDGSSVVQLYQYIRKPVMVQNATLTIGCLQNMKNKVRVLTEDVIYYNDYIWFCASNFNSLFSINVITNEVVFCEKIPQESYSGQRLFTSMELVGDKIYLVPFYAKSIVVFELKSRQFTKKISLDEKKIGCGPGSRPLFMGVKQYDKYLILLPVYSKAIIRLDTTNNELEYITDWLIPAEKVIFNSSDAYFRRQCVLLDDELFIPFCNANAILVLNCVTMQSEIRILGKEQKGYSGICHDGSSFWLSPRNFCKLLCCDKKANIVKDVQLNSPKNEEILYAFLGALYYENKVHLFSGNTGEWINSNNADVMCGSYNFIRDDDVFFSYYNLDMGHIVVVGRSNNNRYVIDANIDIDFMDYKQLFADSKGGVSEFQGLDIRQFIKNI